MQRELNEKELRLILEALDMLRSFTDEETEEGQQMALAEIDELITRLA